MLYLARCILQSTVASLALNHHAFGGCGSLNLVSSWAMLSMLSNLGAHTVPTIDPLSIYLSSFLVWKALFSLTSDFLASVSQVHVTAMSVFSKRRTAWTPFPLSKSPFRWQRDGVTLLDSTCTQSQFNHLTSGNITLIRLMCHLGTKRCWKESIPFVI